MKRLLPLLVISACVFQHIVAQKTSDALRFTPYTFNAVGTRALSMGSAYIGVSDDYTASFWNPAGLAQMKRLEFTGGISNSGYETKSTFYGNSKTESGTSTSLNDIGFVFPFPTVQGSLVFSFGYNRAADYAAGLSFTGFNPTSSIIPTLLVSDTDYNIPYWVYLADSTGGSTIIQKNVNQRAVTKEKGSLGLWSFAGAIDIEENVSVGVTLNIVSGKYIFDRTYVEEDTKNVYSDTLPYLSWDEAYYRFNKFYYDSHNDMEITGSSFTFGFMYRADVFRIGAVVRTPQVVSIKHTYSRAGQSVFDPVTNDTAWVGGAEPKNKTYAYDAYYDFGVSSPWSFGIGGSFFVIPELLLAADIDYTDWSQIEWAEDVDLQKENITLQSNFKGVTSYNVGAEFDVPSADIRLRAGYSLKPSPYKNDPDSFDQHIISGGIGILLQRNILIDAGGSLRSFKTTIDQYSNPSSRTDESITSTTLNITLSYRF